MAKNIQKNLEVPKKSAKFALGFPGMIFEETSSQPCATWKPNEAMSVREMLVRTQRGQRIDVHTRFRAEGIPDNMYMAEYEEVRLPDGTIEKRMKPDLQADTFDHTPPDGVADIVDIIRLQEETNERKAEMKRKLAQRKPQKPDKPNSGEDIQKPQKTEEVDRGRKDEKD